jgi:PAS domain S-box-containing protein
MLRNAPENRRLFRLVTFLAGCIALIVAVAPAAVFSYLLLAGKQSRLEAMAVAAAAQVTDYVSRMRGVWDYAPSRAQAVAERALVGGGKRIAVDIMGENGELRLVSALGELPFPIFSASSEVSDFGVTVGYILLRESWRDEVYEIIVACALGLFTAYLIYFPLRRLPLEAVARAVGDLAAGEAALRKAQAIAHVGSWRFDKAKNKLICSQETLRIYGLESERLLDYSRMAACADAEDAARMQAAWDAALQGESSDFEHPIRVGDEIRWVRERIEALRNCAGEVIGADGVVEDITERHEREERLRRATDAADAGNRAKTRLLANMSHELRTPLNAVIGLSEALALETLGPLGDPAYKLYAQQILGAGDRLLELISDLLYAADIENGELKVQEGLIDVRAEIAAAAELYRERAQAQGVELKIIPYIASLQLRGDVAHFRRILSSLLSNAVAFSPKGEVVALRAFRDEQGRTAVAVADHGVGLTEAEIAAALKPFGRPEIGDRYRHEGAGLGLSIAVSLADAHGGSLTVKSEKGRGSTFIVTFPAERAV